MTRALFPKLKLDELWREARRAKWTNSRELEITSKVLHMVEHLKLEDGPGATRNYEMSAIIRIMSDLDTQNRIRTALLTEIIRSLLDTIPKEKAREIRERIADLSIENLHS